MPEPTLIAERPANLDVLIDIPDVETTSWKRWSVHTLLCNGRVETQYATSDRDLFTLYEDRCWDLVSDYSDEVYHSRLVVAIARDINGQVAKLVHSGEWSCQSGHAAS